MWTTFDPMDGGNHIDPCPEAGLSVMACIMVCIYLPPDLPVEAGMLLALWGIQSTDTGHVTCFGQWHGSRHDLHYV